ncbi:MAG: ECF-type sigma factor [Planctomycetota bacterium]
MTTDECQPNAEFEGLYDELRRLSAAYLTNERVGHTLQATALVNEAFMSLASREDPWNDRAHLFRAAAQAMRHILINHERDRRAQKRGGGGVRLSLTRADGASEDPEDLIDLLSLDAALHELEAEDPTKSRLVELRFFAGCTMPQAADVLGVSLATAERHWRFARAWLYSKLAEE